MNHLRALLFAFKMAVKGYRNLHESPTLSPWRINPPCCEEICSTAREKSNLYFYNSSFNNFEDIVKYQALAKSYCHYILVCTRVTLVS